MSTNRIRFFLGLMFLLASATFSAQKRKETIENLIDEFARTLPNKPDSAFYFITKATAESKKTKDEFLLSRCYYNLGYYFYLNNQTEKSKYYIYKSIPFAQRAKNYKILSRSHNQLGLLYKDKTNYNEALKHFLKSLQIAESNKLPDNQCNAMNNIGMVHEIEGDTIKAMEYYTQAQQIALQNDFKPRLIETYNNIAILKFKYDKKSSIANYNKAYAIATELGDAYNQFNILINLSDIYSVYQNKTQINQALAYLVKAQKIAQTANDEALLFYVHFNLGGCYKNLKNYTEAIKNYTIALNYSKQGITKDQMVGLYKGFELTYKEMGDFKKAYEFRVKNNVLKDSIFTIEKNYAFKEIQTKYEVDKKNLKIQLLTKEKIIQQRRKQFIVIVGGILLVSLFVLLLFLRHRSKTQRIIADKENKILKQEVGRLENEKELKRALGVIEGQDQERNRVAKEIHDGVGGALAGIKLQLAQVNATIKEQKIEYILHQLTNTFNDLRAISHNLSSNYIDNNDFLFLIQKLLDDYQNRAEFSGEIVVFPEQALQSLSEELKHQLYRIVQELLANISKHAKATKVMISFTQFEDSLNVIVEDNGIGFANSTPNGIGLKNIHERLSMINGTMTIESKTNTGTTVLIDIKLNEK